MSLDLTRITRLHSGQVVPVLDDVDPVTGIGTGLPGGMMENTLVAIYTESNGRLAYAKNNVSDFLHRLPLLFGNPVPTVGQADFGCNNPGSLVPTTGINADPNNENKPGMVLRQTVSLFKNSCQNSHFRSITSWSPSYSTNFGDPKSFFPSGCDGATWRINATAGGQTITLATGGFMNGRPTGPSSVPELPDSMRLGPLATDFDYICPG